MTNANDSIHALINEGNYGNNHMEYSGLTKREYFAAMAMQGMLAGHYEYFKGNDDVSIPSMIAEYAILNADALINELNKQTHHENR